MCKTYHMDAVQTCWLECIRGYMSLNHRRVLEMNMLSVSHIEYIQMKELLKVENERQIG